MRLVVFGSTGGTGPFVLREAIGRGHDVTAFARRPDALSDVVGLTRIVSGDAREPGAVLGAVTGQDAVIVTVSGRGQPDVIRTIDGTVVDAMVNAGVRRLVVTSAYGIVADRPFVVAGIVRRIFAKTFADQSAGDEIVRASALDWTIARATRLKPGAIPGSARISTELFTKGPYSIGRASWAAALVTIAERPDYQRQIVHVTG